MTRKIALIATTLLAPALLLGCKDKSAKQATNAPVSLTDIADQSVDETKAAARALMTEAVSEAGDTQGGGSPAIWTFSDDDSTVHLFGTIHLLRPETQWRSSDFTAAFTAADRLVLEADTESPEVMAEMQTVMMSRAMYSDGTDVRDVLPDQHEPAIDAALSSMGANLEAVRGMRPWFIGLQMSVAQLQRSGYDPMSGVDMRLSAEARAAGKSLGYLETAESQLMILSGGTAEEQAAGLVFGAYTIDMGSQMLDTMVDEWSDGDVVGLGSIMSNPAIVGGQKAYDALLTQRNKNWVPLIKGYLDEPGTTFIAVGAAHLAGPDSVITMLRDDGIKVEGP